ncbi:MAG: TolC family protein [Cytophagaceae bacterium]|nr:TolC family protein [Cytophagaceae bacterium]MDW8455404.1 TolC family protein [Cytophagaceae bacterium]
MKKIFLGFAVPFYFVCTTLAQDTATFNLQQCIDYALKNNTNVKNAQFDEYIAKAQAKEVRGIGLPQVNASATVIDNPNLKKMFIPFQQGDTTNFLGLPPTLPTDVYVFNNFFQTRNSGDINLTANQLLLSGSYIVGLQAAKGVADLMKTNTTLTKVQTVENVTKAYYLVLINKERVNVFDANLTRLDSARKQTKALYEQGFVEKIDADRMDVAYNNLFTERQKFIQMLQLSTLLLKFHMGYDVNKNLQIAGDIKNYTPTLITTSRDTGMYKNRAEYKLLQKQYALEKLNMKNKYMEGTPTLALFGTLGYIRSTNSLGALFKRSPDLPFDGGGRIFKNNWYYYDFWGISLNVPLLSGLSRTYKIQQSKINLKKIQNNIDNFKQASDMEVIQAEVNMKNAQLNLESHKKNVELAKEVARLSKIKYEQGVGSNLEVVDAESSYKEAQTNYYDALYQLIISEIDYKKATGTLYNEQ